MEISETKTSGALQVRSGQFHYQAAPLAYWPPEACCEKGGCWVVKTGSTRPDLVESFEIIGKSRKMIELESGILKKSRNFFFASQLRADIPDLWGWPHTLSSNDPEH